MRGRLALVLPLALVLLPLAGCGGGGGAALPHPTPTLAEAVREGTVTVQLGERPFRLYVPKSYSSAQPVPLVVGLHGYTSSSAELESYFQLARQADRRGFLYAMPDGTVDRGGDQFWNATSVCCDIYHSGVDDSGYLSQLIEKVKQSYAVDPHRVYVIGHSNGGYMAHRMACDHADQITAIASLAGAVFKDPTRCQPSRPVTVLQIHGTGDQTVLYTGGAYPGAEETVALWRKMDGCTDQPDPSPPALDFDTRVDGAETTVISYTHGCGSGSHVELWRMAESGHVPALSGAFVPAVLDYFYAVVSP